MCDQEKQRSLVTITMWPGLRRSDFLLAGVTCFRVSRYEPRYRDHPFYAAAVCLNYIGVEKCYHQSFVCSSSAALEPSRSAHSPSLRALIIYTPRISRPKPLAAANQKEVARHRQSGDDATSDAYNH